MGTEQALIIELPEDLVASAAAGWVGPDEKTEEAPEVKETKEPKINGVDPTVFDTIKRERDEAIARAQKLEEDRQKDIADRDAKLSKAEEKARDNEFYALRAHHEKVVGELNQIETAIHSTKMTLSMLEQQAIAAGEAGDKTAEMKAQRAIAKAEAELVQMEAGKSGAEQEVNKAKSWVQDSLRRAEKPEKTETKEEPKVEAKKEPKVPSKDEWLSDLSSKTSPKVAQWLREHPEFTDDPKKHQKWLAFTNAYATVDDGDLRGEEFLDALNSKFFPEKERAVADEEDEKPQRSEARSEREPEKKKAPPGAPVNRGGDFFSSKNPNGRQLKLHPRLVSAAKEIGSDPEIYAKNIRKMMEEGKYPKNYLDWDYQDNLK